MPPWQPVAPSEGDAVGPFPDIVDAAQLFKIEKLTERVHCLKATGALPRIVSLKCCWRGESSRHTTAPRKGHAAG